MPPAVAPRAPLSAAAPFDPLQLRRALGSFGTGVTVVSTLAAGDRPVGVTANSFSSVSLDPPIVLWSLNRYSPSLAAFDHCGRFVVNVLALDQVALSRRFATSLPDKFDGVAYQRGLSGQGGPPMLHGALAHFECRTEQRLEVGDHVLFLGRVEAFEHGHGAGLLYCQGRYAQGIGIEGPDAASASQPQAGTHAPTGAPTRATTPIPMPPRRHT